MITPAYLAALALLSLGLSKVLITLFRRARSPLSSVPGPWISKWTSVVLDYHGAWGQRAIYIEGLHQRYGPVVRVSPTEVDFSSISAAKTIHSFNRPFLKSELYSRFGTVIIQNVFTTRDPDFHARHRRLLSGPISESNLKDFEHIIRARADLVIERIGAEMKTRGAADVMKWSLFFSTDVIGELTFGDSFRMLEQGKKNQYAIDLSKLAFLGGLRIGFPTLTKLASYLPLPLFREAIAANKRMRSYSEQSIQRYERLVAADPWNPKPTLFTKMFKAGEEGLSHEEIVSEAQAYIIAGSDTTAQSLTYLIWAVCRNDAVKKRLVDEVVALPDGYGDDDLKSLPYLNQVIYETLRSYAAAPSALPREVPKGGCEVDRYWMPGGVTVSTQAYSMHRNPAVFPEPERFNPSRWETPTKEMKDAWMPFGGGARICLGMHLAQMELRSVTARFFRMFPDAKVSNLEGFGDGDMEQVIYFLMVPKNKRCLIRSS